MSVTNSNCMQNQIFGYEQWAVAARQDAVAIITNRAENEIKALNAATQAAVASLHARNVMLENHMVRLSRQVNQRDEQILKIDAKIDANHAISTQNQSLILEACRHYLAAQSQGSNAQVAANPPLPAVPIAAAAQPPQQPPQQPPPNLTQAQCENRRRQKASLRKNAPACLRRTPLQPPIGACPISWKAAMVEWETGNLSQYLSVDDTEWSNAMKSKWNKFKSIHREVVRHQLEGKSLDHAATYLDLRRNSRDAKVTLTKHLDEVKKGNPALKRRTVVSRKRRSAAQPQQQRRQRPVPQQPARQPVPQPVPQPVRQQPAPQPQAREGRGQFMVRAALEQRAQPFRRLAQGERRRNLPETAHVLLDGVAEQVMNQQPARQQDSESVDSESYHSGRRAMALQLADRLVDNLVEKGTDGTLSPTYFDWAHLGSEAAPMFRRTIPDRVSFLNGPLQDGGVQKKILFRNDPAGNNPDENGRNGNGQN
jgi:hypothetical protein